MPAPPKWTYVLTELNGTVLGEVTQAIERSVTLPLNRIPTASLKVPIWHPIAQDVLTKNTLLKVYRRDAVSPFTDRLIFHGPVISAEESGEAISQTLAINAVGPMWRLTRRLIGTSKAGWELGTTTATDLVDIARNIILTVNGQVYTGISLPGSFQTTPQTGGYGPVHLKNAAEAIAEIASGLNAFDYQITPTEPTVAGGGTTSNPQIGTFDTYYPVLGQSRPDAIFEYGTTRANVTSYTRSLSRDQMLTRGWIALPGFPDGLKPEQDTLGIGDSAAISAHGLFEDVINDAGIIDDGLRTSLVQEHLKYRANPKQIATFKPALNVRPTPFVEYNVGDWVRCIAYVRGTIRFDAMFRIWGANFSIDQNGNESLDLQLVQES